MPSKKLLDHLLSFVDLPELDQWKIDELSRLLDPTFDNRLEVIIVTFCNLRTQRGVPYSHDFKNFGNLSREKRYVKEGKGRKGKKDNRDLK